MFNRKYIFKWWAFHCYVSSPKGARVPLSCKRIQLSTSSQRGSRWKSNLTITCIHEVHTQWCYTDKKSDFNESKHKHKDVEASRLAVSSSSYFTCIIDTHTKIMNFNYKQFTFQSNLMTEPPNLKNPPRESTWKNLRFWAEFGYKPWWQCSAPQHCQWLEEG